MVEIKDGIWTRDSTINENIFTIILAIIIPTECLNIVTVCPCKLHIILIKSQIWYSLNTNSRNVSKVLLLHVSSLNKFDQQNTWNRQNGDLSTSHY